MKPEQKKLKQVQRKAKKIEESLSYTVEVTDKEGRVLQRISAPSRSYVKAWNQLIDSHAKTTDPGGPFVIVTDTSEANKNAYSATRTLKADAAIGSVTYGIRIGKGATAVTIDDYALESPCGEGSGVNQFEHQAVQFTEPIVSGSTCYFTVKRVMLNNSGATITGIREIGCYIQFTASALGQRAMGFRDVLPSAVTIPDGGAITVTYTLKVTV
ncbi:hypothetical protein ES703_72411 [subsurface metagenome]